MYMDITNKTIIDDGAFGEIPCQIAPIGEFYGSDRDGNPISETLTSESLSSLANKLNESGKEILCDKDHASVKPGTDRDTEAQGWFSRFFIDPIKGLMGWLKLTKSGRDAIENREYRFLSPVFSLDDESKTPTNLHSVAMTNCAALPVEPILNTEPNKEILNMEITKEDLVSLIREVLMEMKKTDDSDDVINSCQKKAKNEMPEDKKNDTEKTDDKADTETDKVDEADTVDSSKEETDKAETDKPEIKEEMKDEETVSNSCQKKAKNEQPKGEEIKKQKEVIKEEVLNSAPNNQPINLEISAHPSWYGKTGEEFWKELRKLGYRV